MGMMSMQLNVAVAAVIRGVGNRILLIQRGHAPERGRWAVPGGHVEAGEGYETALCREVWEETSLEVEVGPLLYVSELQNGPERLLILDFGIEQVYSTNAGRALSDAKSLGYFSESEWQDLNLAQGMTGLLTDSRVRRFLAWA